MRMSPWLAVLGAVAALASVSSAKAQQPVAAAPLAPAVPVTVSAQAPTPAQSSGPEKLALTDDGLSRMTIPVMVDGQGPFPFIIDTGADRTVISSELAAMLKLPSGPHVTLHESAGVDDVQTVVIDRLDVGKRTITGIDAPVLLAANLGAMGLLGIDSLQDQHVVLDFKDKKLLSVASRPEFLEPGTIVVRGKSRFGQLVLVDATVRGVPVWVILDSGAQNTVGNMALKQILTYGDSRHQYPPTQIISVTGRTTAAVFDDIAEMQIGAMTIQNMPLAFADLHTFARFGLANRPAMLLGMDVLGHCQQVTVDFKRREASFTIN